MGRTRKESPPGFVSPMLASPWPEGGFTLQPGVWAAEEKFDGHRLVVRIHDDCVTAWSRNGLERELPGHILRVLRDFPGCTLDGELLVPGKRSYGTADLSNTPELIYFVFDILDAQGQPVGEIMSQTYESRQRLLIVLFPRGEKAVQLAPSTIVNTEAEVQAIVQAIWDRDGEGVILKRRDGKYRPAKRDKGWIKIKAEKTAVLTFTGFQAGLLGPFSIALLQDDEGHQTAVKWKSYEWLDQADAAAKRADAKEHPWIGRKVCIEFQERTPDGSYRHPRWDRWEEE
jgi:ATP-dependent DNA ligase